MRDNQVYDLATQIKQSQGTQRYLKDVATSLNRELVERRIGELVVPIRAPHSRTWIDYRARRSVSPPTTVRRLRAAELRKYHPDIYRAVVTEIDPPTPFTLRLASKTGSKSRSREWAEWEQIGAERAQSRWEQRYDAHTDWNLSATKVRVLHDIRAAVRQASKHEEDLRYQASELVAAQGYGVGNLSGQSDGLIQVTAKGCTRKIDYDLIDTQYPIALRYVSETQRAGYETVLITEVAPIGKFDPEGDQEPFEGE